MVLVFGEWSPVTLQGWSVSARDRRAIVRRGLSPVTPRVPARPTDVVTAGNPAGNSIIKFTEMPVKAWHFGVIGKHFFQSVKLGDNVGSLSDKIIFHVRILSGLAACRGVGGVGFAYGARPLD